MWPIDIDNGGTTERTYVLIHTDDIDGITRNPAHGVAIKDAFDKRFGVKVVDPRFMLVQTFEHVSAPPHAAFRPESGLVPPP